MTGQPLRGVVDEEAGDHLVGRPAPPEHRRPVLGHDGVSGELARRGVAGEVDREGEALGLQPQRLQRDGAALGEAQQPDRRIRSDPIDPRDESGCGGGHVGRVSAVETLDGVPRVPGGGPWRRKRGAHSGVGESIGQVGHEAEQVALVRAVAVEEDQQRASGARGLVGRPQHDVVVEHGRVRALGGHPDIVAGRPDTRRDGRWGIQEACRSARLIPTRTTGTTTARRAIRCAIWAATRAAPRIPDG